MGRARRAVPLGVAAAALAVAAAGCTHSSRVYPYDLQTVWRAAIGECVIWRPDKINEDDFVITSTRIPLGGGELKYELELRPELSLPSRPRTRAIVRIAQTAPVKERFVREEEYFLDRLAATLKEMARAGRR